MNTALGDMMINTLRTREEIIEQIRCNLLLQIDPSALTALKGLQLDPKHLHDMLAPLQPFFQGGAFRLSGGFFRSLDPGLQEHIAKSLSMLTDDETITTKKKDLEDALSYGNGGFVLMMSSVPPHSRRLDQHKKDQNDPSLIAALAVISFPPPRRGNGKEVLPFLYELRTFVAPHTGIGTRLAMSAALLCNAKYGGMTAICSHSPSQRLVQLQDYYAKYLHLFQAHPPYDFSHKVDGNCITQSVDLRVEIILKSKWSVLHDASTFFPLRGCIDVDLAANSVCGLYMMNNPSRGRVVSSSHCERESSMLHIWLSNHLRGLENGSEVAVVTMLGSLCPVTVAHISMFTQARTMLMKNQDKRFRTFHGVLGILSLNTDSHVQQKLKEEALDLFQRQHLVQLAIRNDIPWLFLDERNGNCLEYAKRNFENIKFHHFIMNGADDFFRYEKWRQPLFYGKMIVVGRADYNRRLEQAGSKAELAAKGFYLCSEVHESAHSHVSSSKVRRLLQDGNSQDQLRNMLNRKVLTYLNLYGPWRPEPWLGLYRIQERHGEQSEVEPILEGDNENLLEFIDDNFFERFSHEIVWS